MQKKLGKNIMENLQVEVNPLLVFSPQSSDSVVEISPLKSHFMGRLERIKMKVEIIICDCCKEEIPKIKKKDRFGIEREYYYFKQIIVILRTNLQFFFCLCANHCLL